MSGAPPPGAADSGEIKKSRASLVGGIAVAGGVLALWLAIAAELQAAGTGAALLGALVAGLVGLWIWKADL